jgi:Tfp pilus assembly PilM family ATPase
LPRYLALDWDLKNVRLVEANVGGGAVRVVRAVTWPTTQLPAANLAEEQGRWLKDRLKEAGIAPAPLLVALGRDRIILKDIRYPAVSAAEEPAVIRFQAARELTDASDDLIIDYCPMGDPIANGQKRALVVIGRRDLIGAYHTIAKTAGLKLQAITPRSFGLVFCLNRLAGTSVLTPAYSAEEAAAVVSVSENWAEFCIMQNDSLVFSRFYSTSDALAGEIRRNLVVYAGQAPQYPLHSVYLAGDHAELMAQLQTTPGVTVHRLDPFAGEERPELPAQDRGAFTGAMGLLHSLAGKIALPVNLAQPRQFKSDKPAANRRLVLAGALVGVVLLGGIAICWTKLSRADADVAQQMALNEDLDKQLARLDDDEKRIKTLSDWENGNIVLLDELVEVSNRFGDAKTTQLTQLTASQNDNKKDKYPAKITFKGVTKGDAKAIEDLMAALIGSKRYHSGSHELVENTGSDKETFPKQFTLPVEIEQPKENKPVPNKTAPK